MNMESDSSDSSDSSESDDDDDDDSSAVNSDKAAGAVHESKNESRFSPKKSHG